MILVRDVFQANYGKGGELVALFIGVQEHWPSTYGDRILTDASGSFYTVVTETTMEGLAEWERRIAEVFSLPECSEWFARMMPLVISGRREFYNLGGLICEGWNVYQVHRLFEMASSRIREPCDASGSLRYEV